MIWGASPIFRRTETNTSAKTDSKGKSKAESPIPSANCFPEIRSLTEWSRKRTPDRTEKAGKEKSPVSGGFSYVPTTLGLVSSRNDEQIQVLDADEYSKT